MQFRSTNAKYVHFGGDVVSNVDDSSHGVKLSGGSTGGVVEPVGDETDITLNLRGKGAGGVNLVGGSTVGAFSFVGVSRLQWTVPALTSNGIAPVESTVTFAAATTNSMFLVQPRVQLSSTEVSNVSIAVRCSTAAELRITHYNNGPSTLSGSTMSVYLAQFKIST